MTRRSFLHASSPPAISTRAELEALRSARPKPEQVLHLIMEGPDGEEARREVDVLAVLRIDQIEQRLALARLRFKGDHGAARLRATALGLSIPGNCINKRLAKIPS